MAVSLYDSPLGPIYIYEENGFITKLLFNEKINGEVLNESPLTIKAKEQLDLYFKGELKEFILPLSPKGTPFRKKVWQALLNIPYGKTASYLDIARAIGNEKACRAVGQANGFNPIPIIIPCHRIINSNGKLGGYSGGLELKVQLLEHEKIHYSKK